MRKPRRIVAAFAVVMAALAACVGSDPDPTVSPLTDAGPTGDDTTTTAADAEAGSSEAAVRPTPIQIEAADSFSCALLSDGTVWCWGDNALGQTGVSPPGTTAVPPTQVAGLSDVKAISAGGRSACAIRSDATVWCWGRNTEGELGRPPTDDPLCGIVDRCQPMPKQVANIFAKQVSVGWSTTCAIGTTNSTIICWGRNTDGQCAKPPSPFEPPGAVPAVTDAVAVRLAYFGNASCTVDVKGKVWCWGSNDSGQLGHKPGTSGDETPDGGDGGTYYNVTPRRVVVDAGDLDEAVDAVGGKTSCAVRSDGTLWCWGSNRANLLVLAAPDQSVHFTPTQVAAISGAREVRAGNVVCALLADGEVWCWGPGAVSRGPLYGTCESLNGSTVSCRNPAPMPDLRLRSLDVDHVQAIGITLDGVVVSWGQNTSTGLLGHPPGTNGDSDAGVNVVPTPVVGLP